MAIRILSPQLANQIAAGEVVERPASVVKELVENSLDAGASKIEIDIENGGAGLIRVRDNGCGIAKDELALALARHATSKISDADDLEAILSLGFRGEALASISSVSRLTLTSRTAEQTEAWQVYVQGRDMQAVIKPAAHPVGSTVEVANLFFNTPARRKFLRTDKTEFAHIDEVIRRIALAKFNIAFNLSHNGKMVRQYRPAVTPEQQLKRVAAICGDTFVSHALRIDWRHGDLHLSGWVAEPQFNRAQNDLAYCYINGRMVRDKVINHAIKQAYGDYLSTEQYPAFILFLDLNPHEVDVNVHPTKHEVRFHQARLIHDFICQGISNALQQQTQLPYTVNEIREPAPQWASKGNRAAAGENIFTRPPESKAPLKKTDIFSTSSHFHKPSVPSKKEQHLYAELLNTSTVTVSDSAIPSYLDKGSPALSNEHTVTVKDKESESTLTPSLITPSSTSTETDGHLHLLAIIEQQALLLRRQQYCYLLSIQKLQQWHCQLWFKQKQIPQQALLIPLVFRLDKQQFSRWQQLAEEFQRHGFEFIANADQYRLTLNRVPQLLRQQNLQHCIVTLLNDHHEKNAFLEQLCLLIDFKPIHELPDAIALLGETEHLQQSGQHLPEELLHPINWTPLLEKL